MMDKKRLRHIANGSVTTKTEVRGMALQMIGLMDKLKRLRPAPEFNDQTKLQIHTILEQRNEH